MTDIQWVDPPAKRGGTVRGNGRAQQFVRALRENPGRWALYPKAMKGSGSASSYRKLFPDCEWAQRTRPDGSYDLYARWVGLDEGAAS